MSTTCGICAMFGDHDPNMYATSGALPPRTAVSTFCSTRSLLEYSSLTFTSGCSLLYWSIKALKAVALGVLIAVPHRDLGGARRRRAAAAAGGQDEGEDRGQCDAESLANHV